MLLIGSRALNHHIPDVRPVKDFDLIATPDELLAWIREVKRCDSIVWKKVREDKKKFKFKLRTGEFLEIELADVDAKSTDSNWRFMELNKDQSHGYIPFGSARIASLGSLMAIKRSHLHLPIHWQKNIDDYHLLKSKVGELSEDLQIAMSLRMQEIDKRHEPRRIILAKSNNDFFGQSEAALNRVYEHDDIHLATCYYERPLYERLKPDLSKAYLSKKLFTKLDHQDKIHLVQEEGYAIALERWIIPYLEAKFECNQAESLPFFGKAIQRICTNLTQGWFRDFAIDHYPEVMHNPANFVKKFKESLSSGKIKRKDQKNEG